MPGKPIIFHNAPRYFYRPVIIAEGEWFDTRAPKQAYDFAVRNVSHRPMGPYSVRQRVAEIGNVSPEHKDPSMVVVCADCEGASTPFEVSGIDAPKVLIIGDTHHTPQPLTKAIKLALSQPWDLVVLEFTPHHVKWFKEAGVENTVYIPCLTSINPIKIPPPEKRTRGITFVGQLGRDHEYRRRMLAALIREGLEIEIFSNLTQQEAAQIYNESAVSLNFSLNGDVNLRNFEVIAAGGLVVTDAPNPDAGMCIYWWNRVPHTLSNLTARVKWVLENYGGKLFNPSRETFDHYWAHLAPEHLLGIMFDALSEGYSRNPTPSPAFWDRLAIYERVQEFVMMGRIRPSDFADLPEWCQDLPPAGNFHSKDGKRFYVSPKPTVSPTPAPATGQAPATAAPATG